MVRKIFKIHPAIGICRVGKANSFFVGPEKLGARGVEIHPDHTESPILNYKDGGQIKRQGARFRIFEYEVGDDGQEKPVAEVPGTQVQWRVRLTNSKAAGNKLIRKNDNNRRVLVPEGAPRNLSISDRSTLIIDSGEHAIKGQNQSPVKLDQGQFLGTQVLLGEIRTDNNGNLIVLGGLGESSGIPKNPGDPIPPLRSFIDNDRWYDDLADGPVYAGVTLTDGSVVEAVSAWVISCSPDYAPEAHAPVSLYDITVAVAIKRDWVIPPSTPSFVADILPILKRSLSMRWVQDWQYWNDITDDWKKLSDRTEMQVRRRAFDAIDQASLHDYWIPDHLRNMLTKWRDGIYVDDYDPNYAPPTHPNLFDRAALESCVGANFFPGIEAGFTFGEPTYYSEPGRFSHQAVQPGQLTAQMALPWQADFNDCGDNWWPSQRPNDVFTTPNKIPNNSQDWENGVGGSGNPRNRLEMVNNFWKLGFIKGDNNGNLIESERDASLPPR